MGNNKMMGMLTRNDKTTTSNNRGVEKHIGNAKGIRLDMKIFYLGNRGHQNVKG
jgi:hypothetical protein